VPRLCLSDCVSTCSLRLVLATTAVAHPSCSACQSAVYIIAWR
jgi:hypothetical protein